jgi:hypothetical protein
MFVTVRLRRIESSAVRFPRRTPVIVNGFSSFSRKLTLPVFPDDVLPNIPLFPLLTLPL